MANRRNLLLFLVALFAIPFSGALAAPEARVFDVTQFGAVGDGKTLATAAINQALAAAAAAGGGTVYVPAGVFLSGSIHLKSNVTLYLDQGSIILASGSAADYDPPEPNEWDKYQDYGHSHFHNSLIWGENLENVSILGLGRIWGKGLIRNAGPRPVSGPNPGDVGVPRQVNAKEAVAGVLWASEIMERSRLPRHE